MVSSNRTTRVIIRLKSYASLALVLLLLLNTSSAFAAGPELSGVFGTWLKLKKNAANNQTVIEFRPGSFNYPSAVQIPGQYKTDTMQNFVSFPQGTQTIPANPNENMSRVFFSATVSGNVQSVQAQGSGSSSAAMVSQSIAFGTTGGLETSFGVGQVHASKTNDDDADPRNDKIVIPITAVVKDSRATGTTYGFAFYFKNKAGSWVGLSTGGAVQCLRGEALDFMGVAIIACADIDKGKTQIKFVRSSGGAANQDLNEIVDVDATSICPQSSSSSSSSESQCDDGIDNDDNGFMDCADSVCSSHPSCMPSSSSSTGTEYDCSDNIDNDGNGYIDCDDSMCTSDPVCLPSSSSSSESSSSSSSSYSSSSSSYGGGSSSSSSYYSSSSSW